MIKINVIIFLVAMSVLLFQYCSDDQNEIDYGYLAFISKMQTVEILVPVYEEDVKYEIFFDNYIFFQCVFKKNNNLKYEDFIKDLYLGTNIIKYAEVKNLPHVVVNKTNVWKEYKEKGIDSIIKKYLTKTKKYYYAMNIIPNEELNDLKRILFINSYLVGFDDVFGRYHFQKYIKKH